MIIVATTSLPAVNRPNDPRWNASCLCQKTDENSGHYIVYQQSTARTTTAGTPHACAKIAKNCLYQFFILFQNHALPQEILGFGVCAATKFDILWTPDLRYILGIFWVHIKYISGISNKADLLNFPNLNLNFSDQIYSQLLKLSPVQICQPRHKHTLGIYQAYLSNISGIFKAYVMLISGIYHTFFRYRSGNSQPYLPQISIRQI